MEHKAANPLLAGLFNMLIPGSSHIYINRNWSKFALPFIVGTVLLIASVLIGSGIEGSKNYPLVQGLCPTALVLVVMTVLFISGRNAAKEHNHSVDTYSAYKLRMALTPKATREAQLLKNQQMRTGGLISDKEFNDNKDNINATHDK